MKVEIYDPAMCCPTGICGPGVDPKLVAFAADIQWLKDQGIFVERYNLAQQPDKFVTCKVVTDAMALSGDLCLPLIVINDKVVSTGDYPTRKQLQKLVGLDKNFS